MKKSQLRKLIREMISEQMNEPTTYTGPFYGCCLPNAMNYNSTIAGQGCDNCSCIIAGPGGDQDVAGYITGNDIPENNNSCYGELNTNSGPTSACPACDAGNYIWGNMQNWIPTFGTSVSNLNTNSSNPNQPCQFLQSRIDLWTTTQQGLGGCNNYYNTLACKIKHVQTALMPQYNC